MPASRKPIDEALAMAGVVRTSILTPSYELCEADPACQCGSLCVEVFVCDDTHVYRCECCLRTANYVWGCLECERVVCDRCIGVAPRARRRPERQRRQLTAGRTNDIAKVLRLSRQRVRQLENSALHKLRSALHVVERDGPELNHMELSQIACCAPQPRALTIAEQARREENRYLIACASARGLQSSGVVVFANDRIVIRPVYDYDCDRWSQLVEEDLASRFTGRIIELIPPKGYKPKCERDRESERQRAEQYARQRERAAQRDRALGLPEMPPVPSAWHVWGGSGSCVSSTRPATREDAWHVSHLLYFQKPGLTHIVPVHVILNVAVSGRRVLRCYKRQDWRCDFADFVACWNIPLETEPSFDRPWADREYAAWASTFSRWKLVSV